MQFVLQERIVRIKNMNNVNKTDDIYNFFLLDKKNTFIVKVPTIKVDTQKSSGQIKNKDEFKIEKNIIKFKSKFLNFCKLFISEIINKNIGSAAK